MSEQNSKDKNLKFGRFHRPSQAVRKAQHQGVYRNLNFTKCIVEYLGNVVKVYTSTGAIFEGIFKCFSNNFEIVISLAHRVDPLNPLYIPTDSLVENIIFKPHDVLMIEMSDTQETAFVKNKLTIESLDEISEKELVSWEDEENITEGYILDEETAKGWDAKEMFKHNKQDKNSSSSFENRLSDYTLPLPNKHSKEYKEAEAKASKIANEIKSSYKQQTGLELVNLDEKDKFPVVKAPIGNSETKSLHHLKQAAQPNRNDKLVSPGVCQRNISYTKNQTLNHSSLTQPKNMEKDLSKPQNTTQNKFAQITSRIQCLNLHEHIERSINLKIPAQSTKLMVEKSVENIEEYSLRNDFPSKNHAVSQENTDSFRNVTRKGNRGKKRKGFLNQKTFETIYEKKLSERSHKNNSDLYNTPVSDLSPIKESVPCLSSGNNDKINFKSNLNPNAKEFQPKHVTHKYHHSDPSLGVKISNATSTDSEGEYELTGNQSIQQYMWLPQPSMPGLQSPNSGWYMPQHYPTSGQEHQVLSSFQKDGVPPVVTVSISQCTQHTSVSGPQVSFGPMSLPNFSPQFYMYSTPTTPYPSNAYPFLVPIISASDCNIPQLPTISEQTDASADSD